MDMSAYAESNVAAMAKSAPTLTPTASEVPSVADAMDCKIFESIVERDTKRATLIAKTEAEAIEDLKAKAKERADAGGGVLVSSAFISYHPYLEVVVGEEGITKVNSEYPAMVFVDTGDSLSIDITETEVKFEATYEGVYSVQSSVYSVELNNESDDFPSVVVELSIVGDPQGLEPKPKNLRGLRVS